MNARLVLLLLVVSAPAPAFALDLGDARHLLERTGFGATDAEIAGLRGLDRRAAVAHIVGSVPDGVHEAQRPAPDCLDTVRIRDRKARRRCARSLQRWWYAEMATTPHPLLERMTLFWHGHFPSSLRKVRSPALLHRQNVTLRRHALGSFDALLHAIARDPAMLLYLDGARSKRQAPNENFAREVMELFTLGKGGGYTEADIKEAARAFTGWSVRRRDGTFRFRRRWHGAGQKTVLGHTGALDGDAVLDLLLAHPSTARHIVRAMWRHFISETPDEGVVERLAARSRARGHAIRPLLADLLNTDAFWAARGRLVKSPTDLLVGLARRYDIPLDDPDLRVERMGRAMGQALFAPPGVDGWPVGVAWIDTVTWVVRARIVRRVANNRVPFGDAVEPDRLLAVAPTTAGGRTHALLKDPAFQLK